MRTHGLGTIPGFHKVDILKEDGKFPIGTIRSWQSGDVIKINDKDWEPIDIPINYHNYTKEIGILASQIYNTTTKFPVDKKEILDYYLNLSINPDISNSGALYKRAIPDFANGLNQVWVYNWINKGEQIPESKLKELHQNYTNVLEFLNKGFKNSGSESEEKQIEFDKINDYLNKITGVNYTPFEDVKKELNSIKKRFKIFEPDESIEDFVASQMCKINLKDKLNSYFEKYKDQIFKEDAEAKLKELGLTYKTASTNLFYMKLGRELEKLSDTRKLLENTITFKEAAKSKFEEHIDTSLQGHELKMLNYILEKRFETFNKKIEKENDSLYWDKTNYPVLHNFESFMKALPAGHVLNNEEIKMITNHFDYYETNIAYALYNTKQAKISFSNKATNFAQIKGNLNRMNEFTATLLHETGHALSMKMRKIDYFQLKKFNSLCGWTNTDDKKYGGKYNFNATGGNKPVIRRGINNQIPLLTNYSYTSPNEAFAEYYSFYFLNKNIIDSWLDGKDTLVDNAIDKIKLTGKESDEDINDIFTLIFSNYKTEFKKRHINFDENGEFIKFYKELDSKNNIVIKTKPLTITAKRNLIQTFKEGYYIYRINDKIPVYNIKQNIKAFKWLKDVVFSNDKIIKALQNLGII